MNLSIKNFIFYAAAVIGVVVLIAWAAVSENKPSKNSGNLSVSANSALIISEQAYDFGTISMEKGKVSHVFEVKNSGNETVTIDKVYTSCMCTKAIITNSEGKQQGMFSMPGHGGGSAEANIPIKANETIRVEAIFDPAAHGPSGVGKADRSIYLETNSAQSPKIELQFSAIVTR